MVQTATSRPPTTAAPLPRPAKLTTVTGPIVTRPTATSPSSAGRMVGERPGSTRTARRRNRRPDARRGANRAGIQAATSRACQVPLSCDTATAGTDGLSQRPAGQLQQAPVDPEQWALPSGRLAPSAEQWTA